MAEPQVIMFARMKPHTPHGHRMRSYFIKGARFRLDKGWHKITPRMANRLRRVRGSAHDEHSPLVFDVCTKAQAVRIEQIEEERTRQRDDPFTVQRVTMSRDDIADERMAKEEASALALQEEAISEEDPWPEDEVEKILAESRADFEEEQEAPPKDKDVPYQTPPFPIVGYDEMNVHAATTAVQDLDARDLRRVLAHEKRNKKRIGVCSIIEQMLEQL